MEAKPKSVCITASAGLDSLECKPNLLVFNEQLVVSAIKEDMIEGRNSFKPTTDTGHELIERETTQIDRRASEVVDDGSAIHHADNLVSRESGLEEHA